MLNFKIIKKDSSTLLSSTHHVWDTLGVQLSPVMISVCEFLTNSPSALQCVTPQTTVTSLDVVDIPQGSFHLIIKLSPCSLCTYRHAGCKVLDVHNSRPVCGCYHGYVKLFSFCLCCSLAFQPRPKTLAAKFHSPIIFFLFLKWVIQIPTQDMSQTRIPTLFTNKCDSVTGRN